MSANTTNLQAFLLWNIIVHSLTYNVKRTFQAMRFYWLAAMERYSVWIRSMPGHLPGFKLIQMSFIEGAVVIVLIVFVIGALAGPLANATTGITVAHTGFTPNPNVTASPGASPLLQLYPLFFIIFGLILIAKAIGTKYELGL